jgi:hypothetical protein
MSGLSQYSAAEILAELQRRIHCRNKAESRTILVGPPGTYILHLYNFLFIFLSTDVYKAIP